MYFFPLLLGKCSPDLRFVHQYDDEYDHIKKTRRSGRPPSAREDLLKMKIEALEKEYQHGFCTLDSNRPTLAEILTSD